VSVFCKDETGSVFHTYSTYARGIDMLSVDYHYLDLVPKGRDEGGRGPFWVRRHDEYGRWSLHYGHASPRSRLRAIDYLRSAGRCVWLAD
jgi:hypothetical protein